MNSSQQKVLILAFARDKEWFVSSFLPHASCGDILFALGAEVRNNESQLEVNDPTLSLDWHYGDSQVIDSAQALVYGSPVVVSEEVVTVLGRGEEAKICIYALPGNSDVAAAVEKWEQYRREVLTARADAGAQPRLAWGQVEMSKEEDRGW